MLKSKKSETQLATQWTVADLGSFYQQHRSDLVSYATRLLKSSSKAEEVVQDALIRVLLATPELKSEVQAFVYMRKTVENLCLDVFRLEGRQPNLVVLDEATAEIDARLATPDNSELIAAADDAAIIRQALSLLSPAERAALVMWEMEGRSTEEIARELGIKESSVRHTVARARASLRRILSEYVVDEKRGLTALDLLSTTYKKTLDTAKRSSKAALSLVVLVFAFFGFNNFSDSSTVSVLTPTNKVVLETTSNATEVPIQTEESVSASGNVDKPTVAKEKVLVESVNAKAAPLWFEGLDKNGVPTGFTVTDSLGTRGTLYINSRDAVITETELSLAFVSKTVSGAANIFLNQTITQDSTSLRYASLVSYGREGRWIPLNAEVLATDIERLGDGNYLLTATLRVKSEVETTIIVPAVAGGRDLVAAPSRVVTRLVLSPDKTKILAQAVQVVEKRTK